MNSVVVLGDLRDGSNAIDWDTPSVFVEAGAGNDAVELRWRRAFRGDVNLAVRID